MSDARMPMIDEMRPAEQAARRDRRSFIQRASLASLGAAAAVPVLSPDRAHAAGTPAYVDEANTFTAPQTIEPATDATALTIRQAGSSKAAVVNAHGSAVTIQHTSSRPSATADLVDLWHRNNGDAIYIVHEGGDAGGGGNAGLNILNPYHRDSAFGGTGRDGSVINTNPTRSLVIQHQNVNGSAAAEIDNWGPGSALYINNQFANGGAYAAGGGNGITIDDYGTSDTVRLKAFAPQAGGQATLCLDARNVANSRDSASFNALRVVGGGATAATAIQTATLGTDGRLRLYNSAGVTKVDLNPADGSVKASAISGTALTLSSGLTANGISNINIAKATGTAFYVQTVGLATWGVRGDGRMLWGAAGSFGSAGDTNLYRGAPDMLATDDAVRIGKNSAPADGDLANGTMAFWFDSSNGSPKLMVKAKRADGTVVTGELTLS